MDTTTTTKTGLSTRKLSDTCHAVTYGPEFLERLQKEIARKGRFTVYYHSLPAQTGQFSHKVYFDKQKAEHSS